MLVGVIASSHMTMHPHLNARGAAPATIHGKATGHFRGMVVTNSSDAFTIPNT